MKRELRIFAIIAGVFLFAYLVPFSNPTVRSAILEAFFMLQEYARQHVLLCLVPAFFIAGAIAVFISQASVIKYLGGKAKKVVSYSVGALSGAILAVCSCTILPLFAGIYKRGAGLGPAISFLYSGPAINILAIILTGRILGIEFGLARAVGAIVFAVVIGLVMQVLFRKEEAEKQQTAMAAPPPEDGKPLWKTALPIALMVLVLVFANWGKPGSLSIETTAGETIVATRAGETADEVLVKTPGADGMTRIDKTDIASIAYAPSPYTTIYHGRFIIAGAFLLILVILMLLWYSKVETKAWGGSTWFYAKLILPYLFGGVLIAGFLLGRPGHLALIPPGWISGAVGGNSWASNFVASFAGALMYFATLTELPILQGLMGSGMGDGPALALLLAGPALSLPNMLVIRKILGTKKTLTYVLLVVIAATLTGKLFGVIVG
ncbi:permease [Candidatus Bipolaricaulota bacterium]|nr:permease [Candidatus Bipolaricaulota bacterium]TFH07947.1 MAG: permease [Candidatus Atribacteria bacterium]